MAEKEIIWSARAQQDRLEILEYWINRNRTKTYAEKLLKLFIDATELIAKFPEIGKPTDWGNVRYKIVRDYLLFYEELETKIEILFIWDSRQDLEKLDKKRKNS